MQFIRKKKKKVTSYIDQAISNQHIKIMKFVTTRKTIKKKGCKGVVLVNFLFIKMEMQGREKK